MDTDVQQNKPLPTIWRVSDALWAVIEPVLQRLDPPATTGRKRIEARAALEGIIFRLRSGCQWNHLPKEYPDDSSIHRTLHRWVKNQVFEAIWAILIEHCAE